MLQIVQSVPFKIVKLGLAAISIVWISSGCSFQQYKEKPINTEANSSKFHNKDPASPEFQQYLLSNGYPASQLPVKSWGLEELTYCALYFHPSLDVARAQWRAALANEPIAAERPLPAINGNTARSNQANQDINPYLYGLSFDIPLETANKRSIRIENAQHLSEAYKLDIAQTAWLIRQSVAQALYEYQFNQQQIAVLIEEEKRRQEIAAIYQKRVDFGLLSNVELSTAKLLLQATSLELHNSQQKNAVLRTKLASTLGLSAGRLETMPLSKPLFVVDKYSLDTDIASLQKNALLNRLDIRIALAKYAAAESKLKLEIAKQYPDIVLTPGYAYEFGDKVWSLGIGGLLNLLHKNKNAIAMAMQLRKVEATQFEALQNKVMSDVEIAKTEVQQTHLLLTNQLALQLQQHQNTERMQKRLTIGEIDRLEFAVAKLEDITARKNTLLAEYQVLSAINQLENNLQQPLNLTVQSLKLESLSQENAPQVQVKQN
ncbi:MAG: transporter [Methylotenera sp.]|nr:MAG: transporter [Methylotenera sp.]